MALLVLSSQILKADSPALTCPTLLYTNLLDFDHARWIVTLQSELQRKQSFDPVSLDITILTLW